MTGWGCGNFLPGVFMLFGVRAASGLKRQQAVAIISNHGLFHEVGGQVVTE
jgi:hypothetical protein